MKEEPSTPVMDVSAPPVQAKSPEPAQVSEPKPETSEKATVQAKKAPSKDRGVGMAITATVIIVLGLAIIAAYAYIKQTS